MSGHGCPGSCCGLAGVQARVGAAGTGDDGGPLWTGVWSRAAPSDSGGWMRPGSSGSPLPSPHSAVSQDWTICRRGRLTPVLSSPLRSLIGSSLDLPTVCQACITYRLCQALGEAPKELRGPGPGGCSGAMVATSLGRGRLPGALSRGDGGREVGRGPSQFAQDRGASWAWHSWPSRRGRVETGREGAPERDPRASPSHFLGSHCLPFSPASPLSDSQKGLNSLPASILLLLLCFSQELLICLLHSPEFANP